MSYILELANDHELKVLTTLIDKIDMNRVAESNFLKMLEHFTPAVQRQLPADILQNFNEVKRWAAMNEEEFHAAVKQVVTKIKILAGETQQVVEKAVPPDEQEFPE